MKRRIDDGRTDRPVSGGRHERLSALLARYTPQDGSFEMPVAGVHALRSSVPSTELAHLVHGPALCIIAQGAKTVMLGDKRFHYDASRMLIFSVDLPVAAQVEEASVSHPYLCFRMDLDLTRVRELILQVYPRGLPRIDGELGMFLAPAHEPIMDAAARMMELMLVPEEAQLLAPLVRDEILIRLLRSPIGGRLAQLGQAEIGRINDAVRWLRRHYDQAVSVDVLARQVHMSPSSLHKHFKAATSMSPLQYQKALRLQEARRLMMGAGMEVSMAGQRVGYVSASQFSREYTRMFGTAPSRDVVRVLASGASTAMY